MTSTAGLNRLRMSAAAAALLLAGCPPGGDNGTDPPCTVSSVVVQPSSVSILVGENASLSASLSTANCTSAPSVSWASSSASQVSITGAGSQIQINGLAATVTPVSVTATAGASSGSALITVILPPAIGLTPGNLTFNGQQGAANPASQTIAVANTGGGTLSNLVVGTIVYGAGANGWLSATLTATSGPTVLTVQATTGSLAPGTYTATVPIQAGGASNSPQNVAVSFTVIPAPAIGVNATTMTFNATQGGANPASQAITISNSGGGSLTGLATGTITYGAGASGWLSAPTLSGTTANPTVTMTVQPVTGALAPGSYTATIPITSPVATNSPRTITVTFNVAPPPPTIALGSSSLTFNATQGAANPASQTVTITNGGGGTLSGLSVGTVTYGAGASGWLSVPTLSATTANPSVTLTVQPNTGSLTAGTYTATIPVQSAVAANSPQNVTVTFIVAPPPPAIALNPTSLSFNGTSTGGNPLGQNVNITNGGGGSLSGLAVGTVTYGPGASGWITNTTLSGTTANPLVTLLVSVSPGSMPAGVYTATVPITSGVASNSPQNVTVTFTVAPPGPSISLSGTSVSFTATAGGSNPAPQQVSISNGGTGSLTNLSLGAIQYGPGASNWIQAPALSSTNGFPPATFDVAPVISGLSAGTYTATIPVLSSVATNSPQNLTVSLVVSPAPSIQFSTNSLTFSAPQGGADPASQTITITNGGGGTLSGLGVFSTTFGPGASGWIQTASLSGTIANPSVTLTVRPATGSLAQGSYTATIAIVSSNASNSPANVSVTFNVTAQSATISPSRAGVAVAGAPGNIPSPTFGTLISNGGSGSLTGLSIGTVTYGAGASGWVGTPTLTSTTAPATLNFSLLSGSYTSTPGTYVATIPILSSVASNSPFNFTASLIVRPPGDPCLPANAAPIQIGQTISALISSTHSCLLPSGHRSDLYRLTVASLTHLVAEASATASFDPFLTLINESNGSVIESDDDDGPGLNPRLTRTLLPGTYILRVRPFNTGTTGSYTITASAGTPGAGAFMSIDRGNGQVAAPGSPVAIPPAVIVRDINGFGVPNVSITFSAVPGVGSITGASAVTGLDGVASLGSWTLAAGPNVVSANVITAVPFTQIFSATGTTAAPSAGFDVHLRFLTMPSNTQLQAFAAAVTRWQSIITTDIADIPGLVIAPNACANNSPALDENADDLIIQVTLRTIDGSGGTLGAAGPCFIRTTGSLPILGEMEFDVADLADLETAGELNAVILHEMGHVIGVGTLWTEPAFNLLVNPSLPNSPGVDTRYTGANGIAGFDAIGGTTYTGGGKVPVENTQGGSGTRDAHWRESVLDNELMTGFLDSGRPNPLSVLTVRSLQDVGYVVNTAAADPFFLTLTVMAGAPSTRSIHLRDDIRRGPIYRVGPDGRVRTRTGAPVAKSR